MHPANQRLGKPDNLSQGAHNHTSYPRVQWENTLDKKGGYRTPGKREVSKRWRTGEHKVKEQSRT